MQLLGDDAILRLCPSIMKLIKIVQLKSQAKENPKTNRTQNRRHLQSHSRSSFLRDSFDYPKISPPTNVLLDWGTETVVCVFSSRTAHREAPSHLPWTFRPPQLL